MIVSLKKNFTNGGQAKTFGPFTAPKYSLKFDSTYENFGRVAIPEADQLFTTGDFSFSYWWKAPSPGFINFFHWQQSDVGTGFESIESAIHSSLGYIRHRFTDSVGGTVLTSNVNVCDDDWHHIVCSCDRDGDFEMWIDGSMNVSASSGCTGDMSIDATQTNAIYLFGVNVAYTSWEDGQIDQVAIFNSALPSGSIAILYNSGTPLTNWPLTIAYPQALWELDEGSGLLSEGLGSNAQDMTIHTNNVSYPPSWEDRA